jgi:hypothetical protein
MHSSVVIVSMVWMIFSMDQMHHIRATNALISE